jgi:hypothetical protein
MWRFIIVTFVLGVFTAAGLASEADAQYRGCSKAPKNYIPCTMQRELPPKPQGKY